MKMYFGFNPHGKALSRVWFHLRAHYPHVDFLPYVQFKDGTTKCGKSCISNFGYCTVDTMTVLDDDSVLFFVMEEYQG